MTSSMQTQQQAQPEHQGYWIIISAYSASECSRFWTHLIFWPYLVPIKILWWYLNRFKSYHADKHIRKWTDTTEYIPPYYADINSRWRHNWKSAQVVNSQLVCDSTVWQPGVDLPRQQWSLLNSFRTELGHCSACRRKWWVADFDLCPCGETRDDVPHCRILSSDKANGNSSRLQFADEDDVSWLTNYDSRHTYEKNKTMLSLCGWSLNYNNHFTVSKKLGQDKVHIKTMPQDIINKPWLWLARSTRICLPLIIYQQH